jgi:hypothetical protein
MGPGAFLQSFPEFEETRASLILAKLAEAAARMGGPNTSVWGSFAAQPVATMLATLPLPPVPMLLADIAQGYLAAHLLLTSPYGSEMTLDPKSKGRSSYLDRFEELESGVAAASGFVVAGGQAGGVMAGGWGWGARW